MNLSECTYGKMVITKNLELGFIVGFRYDAHTSSMDGDTDNEKRLNLTIPVVAFPSETRAIHPSSLYEAERVLRYKEAYGRLPEAF